MHCLSCPRCLCLCLCLGEYGRDSLDYESEDDLRKEDISFTAEAGGSLLPAGRSISLDPGALAGNSNVYVNIYICIL